MNLRPVIADGDEQLMFRMGLDIHGPESSEFLSDLKERKAHEMYAGHINSEFRNNINRYFSTSGGYVRTYVYGTIWTLSKNFYVFFELYKLIFGVQRQTQLSITNRYRM